MKTTQCVCMVLLAPALLRAQESKPDYAAEFKTLEAGFNKAMTAYYEPMNAAKSEEEREKVKVDPEKNPAKAYFAKFGDLAKRGAGSEGGMSASKEMLIISLRWGGDVGKEADAGAIFDTMTATYAKASFFEDFVLEAPQFRGPMGPPKVDALLKEWSSSSNKNVKAAAMYARAAIIDDDEDSTPEAKAEAKKLVAEVRKSLTGTKAAKAAESDAFPAEHLQIGMVAPDFETVDENGKKWRLSDYRGKVAVIDFWGFW